MKKHKAKRGYSIADQIVLMQIVRREDATEALCAAFEHYSIRGIELSVTRCPDGSLVTSLNNRPISLH